MQGDDLLWEISAGYFGFRKKEGSADVEKFKEKGNGEEEKMIEIKISIIFLY